MPDKTVNWGVPGDDARYRTRDDDPAGGGNYVVAETLDPNGDPVEVLLRWDDTAGEWVSGGPVNLDGNDVTNVGALDAGSVSTEQIGSERHYSGSYSGADPDSRLDNALSATSIGDVVYLENEEYIDAHTISTNGLIIVGTGARQSGTEFNGDITVSADDIEFIDINWRSGTHNLNGTSNSIRRGNISTAANITIDGVVSIVEGVMGGSVTLGPNSIQCVVDSCAGLSVTDNGSNNVVGDLS